MKTPIEEMVEYLKTFGVVLNEKTIQEYNEKFKHNITNAHNKGQQHYNAGYNPDISEQYYNETFS